MYSRALVLLVLALSMGETSAFFFRLWRRFVDSGNDLSETQAPPETYSSMVDYRGEGGLVIPNADGTGVQSVLTVPADSLCDMSSIQITVAITHSNLGNLDVQLENGAGRGAALMAFSWACARLDESQPITFDDSSETTPLSLTFGVPCWEIIPAATVHSIGGLRLGLMNGDDAEGDWTLSITDENGVDDGGYLAYWEVNLEGSECSSESTSGLVASQQDDDMEDKCPCDDPWANRAAFMTCAFREANSMWGDMVMAAREADCGRDTGVVSSYFVPDSEVEAACPCNGDYSSHRQYVRCVIAAAGRKRTGWLDDAMDSNCGM